MIFTDKLLAILAKPTLDITEAKQIANEIRKAESLGYKLSAEETRLWNKLMEQMLFGQEV